MKRKVYFYLLLPLSILYGWITTIRNWLYDFKILPSIKFERAIISVGNLVAGGTGKTPHVELLIQALNPKYSTAFLSRGYKRKSKGFVLADKNASSDLIGDEPYQVFRKFRNLTIAVDEKRVRGIKNLYNLQPELDVVLLDDAFQHRALIPGLSILLTDFSRVFTHDFMLPSGRLRECASGSKRADIIIVTKCNPNLTEAQMHHIIDALKPQSHQLVYFSCIIYKAIQPVFEKKEPIACISGYDVLLVTGIANYKPLENELLRQNNNVVCLPYSDHHNFSIEEYIEIEKSFLHLQSDKKVVVFTEKDAARIMHDSNFPDRLKPHCHFVPIKIEIINDNNHSFAKKILSYVESNKRNR